MIGLDAVFVFLVLALLAGILGFTGIEIVSIEIAKTLFFIFLILFIISFLFKILRGKE